MGGEWQSALIEEVAEKVAMGPFGSSIKVETFVPQGIPVISGQHLRGTRLEDNDYNFISLEHADKLANANVKRGDVIFTHAGNIGQAAYIPKSSKYERYIISQRQFYMRPDTRRVLPDFLAYYFASPDGQHKLLANTSSSGVPSIAQPVSYLRKIEILLPPISEQRAIVDILGTLDDKIVLNRRMNETLEAMARALFKAWFVDFEPVRAKAGGRDTNLPTEIVVLFPDSFEDSEIGEVPKGWRVGPLPDFVEVNPLRSLRKGEVAPYLDMANVPTNTARANEVIERDFGSGTKFMNGDTLLARITPCLENGKTAYVDFLEDGRVAWGSTEFIVLRPKQPLPPEFGYLLARDEGFRTFAISNMTGTSGRQRVPSDCFSNYVMTIPPQDISVVFGQQVAAIMKKIKGNDEQSRTLAILRDALLPKLLSGEVRVKDVKRFVEAQ